MSAIECATQTDIQAIKIARPWNMECAEEATRVQEHSDLGFDDLVDLLNPLQHIPVVGTIYRAITGDEIKPEVQLSGDLLYGMATGSVLLSGAMSIAVLVYEQQNGKDPTTQMAQALFGDDTIQPPSPEAGHVQLAAAPLGGVSNTLFGKDTIQSPLPEMGHVQLNAVAAAGEVGRATSSHIGGVSAPLPKPEDLIEKQEAATVLRPPILQKSQRDQSDSLKEVSSLGQKMQEQASAHRAGAPLPPNLVHDMMLMALDKYKTAQTMSPESQSTIQ